MHELLSDAHEARDWSMQARTNSNNDIDTAARQHMGIFQALFRDKLVLKCFTKSRGPGGGTEGKGVV